MNERDSEQVARMFTEGGYTVTPDETRGRCHPDQHLLGARSGGAEGARKNGHDDVQGPRPETRGLWFHGLHGPVPRRRAFQVRAQPGRGGRHAEIPQGFRIRGHHPSATARSPHGRSDLLVARRIGLRCGRGGRLAKHHPRSHRQAARSHRRSSPSCRAATCVAPSASCRTPAARNAAGRSTTSSAKSATSPRTASRRSRC